MTLPKLPSAESDNTKVKNGLKEDKSVRAVGIADSGVESPIGGVNDGGCIGGGCMNVGVVGNAGNAISHMRGKPGRSLIRGALHDTRAHKGAYD